MRSVLVVLLTYLVTCQGEDCQEHEHATHGCVPNPYICQIDCLGPGETKCTGNGTCDEALVTDGSLPTFAEMTGVKCSELCTASDAVEDIAQRCRFWRWSEAAGAAKERTCTLMSDEQCTEYDICSGDHCSCGDNGCKGDAVPDPPKKACEGPIIYEKDHIHWNCHKPSPDGGHLSAYKPGEILEDGATCTTIQKCADWATEGVDLPKTLQVKCNDGKWEADDTGDEDPDAAFYTYVLGEGLVAVKEPPCTGGGNKLRLDIAKIDVTGSDLVCQSPPEEGDGGDDPEGSYVIVAPNNCILLCDYQLGWTLESVLDPDTGVNRFQCETCTDGVFPPVAEHENTQDGAVVECWPARKH